MNSYMIACLLVISCLVMMISAEKKMKILSKAWVNLAQQLLIRSKKETFRVKNNFNRCFLWN